MSAKEKHIQQIINSAGISIKELQNQVVDIIEIQKPTSTQYALQLTKIISKLSPLLGNLFEFKIVDILNKTSDIGIKGKWYRQDPGFPDACFKPDKIDIPKTGIEIKAWFPFATEITGRFKDSEDFFKEDQIYVAVVAWLPEFVFWGKPVIIDTLLVSGKSIAEARDNHYHKPPHYIVFEPEDTTSRTGNLQQTNTSGYVFQDEKTINKTLYQKAEKEISKWAKSDLKYSTDWAYQQKLKALLGKYPYRLDTNYAKIDRIQYQPIEDFKNKVYKIEYKGKTIKEWTKLASMKMDNPVLINAIEELLFG